MSNPRSTAASVREQKLARVIDREVAPVWHDRFARLLLRELPTDSETFALDIHSGPGHTTAELLQRLSENSRIVALGRDPWLMQVSKTRVRPEWKRRVYFKSGDIDDVTGMNDDTYNLTIANLVLGEQVVDWEPALAELMRVTKPGGQVLATLPLSGTWREVEDLFEEMLRDEGMRREVATLQKLRRRRPKSSQLVAGLAKLGLSEHDYIVEHERFELLFRSGREFLFAPVIEHGPLRLWKAIIGRAEKPQALFWRFKETIDTYYAGHVLAVSVVAGLVRLRVPGGEDRSSFSAPYWRRYPSLSSLWGGPGAEEDDDDEFDLDLDIDLDEAIDGLSDEEETPSAAASGSGEFDPSVLDDGDAGFEQIEVSGVKDLPAVDGAGLDDDPFAGMLEELDAEAKAAAEVAAEDAEVEATIQPRTHTQSGRAATLADLEASPLPAKLPAKPPSKPARAADSGASPLPSKLPAKPARASQSGVRARVKPPSKPARASQSGVRARVKPPSKPSSGAAAASQSGVRARVKPPSKPSSGAAASQSGVRARPKAKTPSKPVSKASQSGVRARPNVKTPSKPVPKASQSGVRARPKIYTPSKAGQSGSRPIKLPAKKKKLGKLSDRLPRRASSSNTAIPKDFDGETDEVVAKKKPAVKKPAAKKPAAKKPAAWKRAAKKPAAKKPAPPAVAKAPPPAVTKPGEDDPFAAMLEDDDDLEEIDDLEELPSDSILDGHFDDDDDFEAAFGNLKPDTNVGPPPPPPKKKK